MTLKFIGNAICLSGSTGSKLKCEVIGEYYPFWWDITSGGPRRNNQYFTSIVELNAATGEVHIEDTGETILGSAGHALELKANKPRTENLKVILIEEDRECYEHLKKAIKKRWPKISSDEAEGPVTSNASNVYLLNKSLEDALKIIERLNLGNAIYYFDPLRSVEWTNIEMVARKRMARVFQTGTEFIIFLFTSDWFLGRDDFAPLPTNISGPWTAEEKETVAEADSFFGDTEWRNQILNKNPIEDRERIFIELYKKRLHKWFRYVLPLPFNPKQNQLFHLIICSNFETGIRATKNFYSAKTGNPKYSPSNEQAFKKFKKMHPEIFRYLNHRKRPLQWLILWRIIIQHEEGICDYRCKDFGEIESDSDKIELALKWLLDKGYLAPLTIENAWGIELSQYKLNWEFVKDKLGVDAPPSLKPISAKQIKSITEG